MASLRRRRNNIAYGVMTFYGIIVENTNIPHCATHTDASLKSPLRDTCRLSDIFSFANRDRCSYMPKYDTKFII